MIAGNCGFSLAPVKPEDKEFLGGIFAQVENMDPIALSGVQWDQADTFRSFMDSRRGNLGGRKRHRAGDAFRRGALAR